MVQAQPPPPREAVDERFREFEACGTKGVPMKAIVQKKYGGADVLHLEDIDTPTVGSGEVLLSVQAASLFAGDWHYMAGMPLAFRPASGVTKPRIRVRGRDVAGRVETVGPDVSTFHEGDAVYGICNGAFAEFATATVKKLAPKPANLSFEEAATVPITGTTALQAVRDHGKVQAGQSVLVIGAAGGVGSFAVQIAKAFGAVVTGVCRGRSTRCSRWEPTPSSTTPARTSPRREPDTTSSSTQPGTASYRFCGVDSRLGGRSSSSVAKAARAGSSAASLEGRSKRRWCPC